MLFHAAVETKSGETILVRHPDRRIGGNLILSFLTGLDVYCLDKDDDSMAWFISFESISEKDLCPLAEFLMKTTISGEWDYDENEYESYVERTNDKSLLEEGFRASVRHANSAWTDVESVLEVIEDLIEILKRTEEDESPWFVPQQTLADFQALHVALEEAQQRDFKQVRINIA